jgi:hypothetical protein
LLENGAVYVGASAGSMTACKPYMALLNKRLAVHCPKSNAKCGLPKFFPVKLKNFQAIIVDGGKVEIFE